MATLMSFGFTRKNVEPEESFKRKVREHGTKLVEESPGPGKCNVEVGSHLTKKARLEPPNSDVTPKRKGSRKRSKSRLVESEDSDMEYEPSDSSQSFAAKPSEKTPSLKEPGKHRNVTRSGRKPSEARSKDSTPSTISVTSPILNTPTPSQKKAGVLEAGEHEHNFLPWLQPETIKDINMNSSSDDDYDESTLYVPKGYLQGHAAFHAPDKGPRKITPAMQIWWNFKARYYDTVLFFKVGKFYELYHMDADIGVAHLKMLYMKGDVAHCGFPEISYGKFSSILVSLGYRVARVEQTETPFEMKQRTGKSSGCVKREVCSILSPGTITLSFRDGMDNDITKSVHMLCIYEKVINSTTVNIGVCLCDPTTGRIRYNNFQDTNSRLNLRSICAREDIAEVVFERNNLSKSTLEVLRHMYPFLKGHKNTTMHTVLKKQNDTPYSNVLKVLLDPNNAYFGNELPMFIRKSIKNSTELEVIPECHLSFAALDLCIRVLSRAKIDHELISLRDFSKLVIPGCSDADKGIQQKHTVSEAGVLAVLDGQALKHLEVLNSDDDNKSSLFAFLNRCTTPFGRRQLKAWVSSPLLNKPDIMRRQFLVVSLVKIIETSSGSEIISEMRRKLRKVCDLERMLSRIHALGIKKLSSHPDSRAVLYENEKYNKLKLSYLDSAFTGLKDTIEAQKLLFEWLDCNDAVDFDPLRRFLNKECIEKVQNELESFERTVDLSKAKTQGIIKPRKGLVEAYDLAHEKLNQIKEMLNEELEKERAALGCKNPSAIKFWHPSSGKDIYQIEVPEHILPKSRDAPTHWKFVSKKKGIRRFHTRAIENYIQQYEQAELDLEQCERDCTRGVFERFDASRKLFASLVSIVCNLDCLVSLALVSSESTDQAPMCIPTILENDKGPILELYESRHPVVALGLEKVGKDFIPNDILLGKCGKNCLILTGPNMGGKSTLLRQTCIATIMAQIGCFVPAKSCMLTPVDRIFTRIGASDKIMSGQSTFFVELDETATILHAATKKSLVILDELGRGTSTFDGAAIAYSVIDKICKANLGCRTLFATHYHSLVQEFSKSKNVQLGHMTCFADAEGQYQHVTFLYKLAAGPCDKSHGLNVARLAKISEEILQLAKRKSEEFEMILELKKLINTGCADISELKALWVRAKELAEAAKAV